MRRAIRQKVCVVLATLGLIFAPAAEAARTSVKPGWNLFSPSQDVEIGRTVSQDAERQLPILKDSRVESYIDRLGKRLAAKAPFERYPYQFRVVNDREINAFALPGGFIYINRGVIEAAENEAQLAGVIGHEISHVALRHGTNQASKAYAAQVPLAILGGVLGTGSVGSVLAQIGAGFALNSVLLKYSRDAERQADLLGTQILYDNTYDPRAMAQFFETIEARSKGGRPPEIFSSHPKPENRMERVNEEIQKMGGPPRGYKTDSTEFREIKRYVMSLPAPAKSGRSGHRGDGGTSARPLPPSDRSVAFENRMLRFQHPENWRSYSQGDAVTLTPEGGVVQDSRGNQALAYGVILNVFEPHTDRSGQISLEDATHQLIDDLRQSNPAMRVARRQERVRVGGFRALSTYLTNDSPLSGREYDWLVTVLRPEGLLYFVCVAPEREFDEYDRAFQNMLSSVRFRSR